MIIDVRKGIKHLEVCVSDSKHRRGGVMVERLTRISQEIGFDTRSEQTKVVKTGRDSSTAKLLTLCVSVTGPRRSPL